MTQEPRGTQHDVRRLLEGALDLFLYAPIGVAAMLADDLEAVANRGRREASQRSEAARLVGHFTLGIARSQVEKGVDRLRHKAEVAIWGPPPAPSEPPAAKPSASKPRPAAEPEPPKDGPEAEALPIPGYDTLSASHVVQRLGGLSVSELQAIEAYEASHRARRTVLTKISQLRQNGR